MAPMGKMLVLVGLAIVAVGLIVWGAAVMPSAPILGRIGRLPGDVYVRRGNFSFYFPIATSILISVLLSRRSCGYLIAQTTNGRSGIV